ncbi:MAG: hypothetical protein ACSW8H_02500, partial [bacterium]
PFSADPVGRLRKVPRKNTMAESLLPGVFRAAGAGTKAFLYAEAVLFFAEAVLESRANGFENAPEIILTYDSSSIRSSE